MTKAYHGLRDGGFAFLEGASGCRPASESERSSGLPEGEGYRKGGLTSGANTMARLLQNPPDEIRTSRTGRTPLPDVPQTRE